MSHLLRRVLIRRVKKNLCSQYSNVESFRHLPKPPDDFQLPSDLHTLALNALAVIC